MDCHDALMARRRKKTKGQRSKNGHNNAMLDKSLPSLPPSAVSQSSFSPDQETFSDGYSELTPIELPGSTPTQSRSGKKQPVPIRFCCISRSLRVQPRSSLASRFFFIARLLP